MKTILKSLIFWLVLGNLANAQKPITIKEMNILFKHGSIPGFMVTIPEVPTTKIEESWIKLIEKGTKSKVQKELGEMSIFGSIIKEVAGGPVNVYSYIKEIDSVNILAVSFELKKDEYITSAKREYEFGKAKEYLFLFAQELYLDLAKDELQTEEKKLNKMESNLNSLENEKSRLDKMIQSNNSTIASTNVELVDLRTNLQSLKSELEIQTKELEAMSEGAGKDEKKKYIDDLEKRIKKTNNEIASGEKKVTSLNKEIEDAQKNKLPNNITEQGKLRKDITQQKEVVQIFTNKYNAIKAYKP